LSGPDQARRAQPRPGVPLFDGAPPKNSLEPDAAVALLRFLSSPEAARVITKAGLRPLAPR